MFRKASDHLQQMAFSTELNVPFKKNSFMFCLQTIPYHLQRMDFGTELNGSVDSFQMFWPIVIAHK
jgi:hypothetical protein